MITITRGVRITCGIMLRQVNRAGVGIIGIVLGGMNVHWLEPCPAASTPAHGT